MPLTVCVAEDRQSCEPALRILVASLTRHCPDVPAELYCPHASEEFTIWLRAFPRIHLNPRPLDGIWTKYDIKPIALATTLRGGAEEALWIDSDILIARDFRPLFANLKPDKIAVTEEALCSGYADPDALRARLWGFKVGRVLPFTANTGVVRVTSAHLPLLQAWNGLLQSETYRSAQALPWDQRPLHLMGDQEVLTALLAGNTFANFPLKFLRRGSDIVQFFGSSGYTLRERFAHLWRGPPYFVHSQGFRPWWPVGDPPVGRAARFSALYNALSPYTVHARQYSGALVDANWLRPKSSLERITTALGFGSPPLTGIALAAAADVVRGVKTLRVPKHQRLNADTQENTI